MKPRFRVLISAPYMQPVLERFRSRLESCGLEIVVPVVNERLDEEELLQYVAEVDGVICGDDRFSERVFERAHGRLRVISKWGTGIDSIDRAAAERHGVAVRNTPNAFSEPVADSVLGYMLSFARNIPWMDREMRAGRWQKIPSFMLGEKTLGVIGVGNVGKAVVRRAVGFGMEILGNDLVEIPASFVEETGITMVGLPELLERADFVSVNCDLNPTSHHLLSEPQFAAMRPTAYVINTARGPIIDEKALVAALEQERIAGAGLDVFEDEPLPTDSPLRKLDNVLLAPHNSNSSPRCWEHVHENTIRNLLDGLGLQVKS